MQSATSSRRSCGPRYSQLVALGIGSTPACTKGEHGPAPGIPSVFISPMTHTGLERVRLGPPLMSFSLVGAAIGRDFHHETRWHISGDEREPLDERAPPSMRRSMCWIRRRGVFTLLKPGCEFGVQDREFLDHAKARGSRVELPLG